MHIANLILGAGLLLFGRKLFWLFVGVAGFAAGLYFVGDQLAIHPHEVAIIIAVVVGLLGAVLALFLQKLAIGFAGFCAGGYLGASLAEQMGQAQIGWLGFIVGGILGAIFLLAIFDWALIILSSFTGAALITQEFPMDPLVFAVVFFGVTLAGVFFQASGRKPSRKSRDSDRRD